MSYPVHLYLFIYLFIHIPWIQTGLQNPQGYGNSHICLSSVENKTILKSSIDTVIRSSNSIDMRAITRALTYSHMTVITVQYNIKNITFTRLKLILHQTEADI
jgi:hypothetical protein